MKLLKLSYNAINGVTIPCYNASRYFARFLSLPKEIRK